jgi:PAS domain S-box-containing protein
MHLPRLRAAAVLWLVLLAPGLVSIARRLPATEPAIGVEWRAVGEDVVAEAVAAGGPAHAAGLREGDVLLSWDGEPVDHVLDATPREWSAAGSGVVVLEIRRGEESHAFRFVPERSPRGDTYGYLALVGLAFWVSGLFVTLRWPGVRGQRLYAALAVLLYAQLTLSATGRGDPIDWAIHWGDVVAGALAPALLLHVSLALARATGRERRTLLATGYAASSVLLALAVWLSPGALGGAYRFADAVGALEARDRVEHLFFGAAVLTAVAVLFRSQLRSGSTLHRGQMRWLAWGLGVGLGPFVVLYAIPWGLGAAALPLWAQFVAVLPILLVPAAFTAALARYRLHDLDLFLLRGAVEVTAVFFTMAVYASAVFVMREVLVGILPLSRGGTRYVGILVAAVAYPQLRAWIRAGIERAVYRRRYSYRATLLDWARELNAETDLEPLLAGLRARVIETLGVPEAEVLVRTGPWRFESPGGEPDRSALELDASSLGHLEAHDHLALEPGAIPGLAWARSLFGMKVKGKLRAVLAVAGRTGTDEALTTEDRALLGTLAAHAATAIEAARLVQEVRQRAGEIERLLARQEKILESSAVGLLLLDDEGRIQAWNRALEEIYALPRSEALGRPLGEVFPLHVARRIHGEASRSGVHGGRIFRLALADRNGVARKVNVVISPAGDASDGGGRVVTFDDVTERVALEEQMLLRERLASLGLLAAGVAHEINTPLTGISSYAQMLQEETADGHPWRPVLAKIEAQTRRASGIANSLLDLARPERRSFEPLDWNETVREAVQLAEPSLRGGDVRLDLDLGPDPLPVTGHRGKLQQVVLNLLLNARDAVGESGRIRIATRSVGDRAVLEVADDGVGIAEEDLPRIFDPFFTTKARSKGTGLGLSISYGIVRDHGGRIEAASGEGGTRFTVTLPAARRARTAG